MEGYPLVEMLPSFDRVSEKVHDLKDPAFEPQVPSTTNAAVSNSSQGRLTSSQVAARSIYLFLFNITIINSDDADCLIATISTSDK